MVFSKKQLFNFDESSLMSWILLSVGVLIVLYFLRKYLQSKSMNMEGYDNVQPALNPNNKILDSATEMTSSSSSSSSSSNAPYKDLMPAYDPNSQWGELNPSGEGDLQGVNLLKAGELIGINTVGQSLKNANLQTRSEPPNPITNTGPWNQSTIEPDYMRPALEIGSGSV